MKRITRTHCYLLLAGLVLAISGCSTQNYAAPTSHELRFDKPFNISEVLAETITGDPRNEVHFQILDQAGAPIPYGLLRLEWTENGGRMSFQTDENGALSMHFEKDILSFEVMVSADIKPIGQDLLKAEDYEQSSTRLTDGLILVRW